MARLNEHRGAVADLRTPEHAGLRKPAAVRGCHGGEVGSRASERRWVDGWRGLWPRPASDPGILMGSALGNCDMPKKSLIFVGARAAPAHVGEATFARARFAVGSRARAASCVDSFG